MRSGGTLVLWSFVAAGAGSLGARASDPAPAPSPRGRPAADDAGARAPDPPRPPADRAPEIRASEREIEAILAALFSEIDALDRRLGALRARLSVLLAGRGARPEPFLPDPAAGSKASDQVAPGHGALEGLLARQEALLKRFRELQSSGAAPRDPGSGSPAAPEREAREEQKRLEQELRRVLFEILEVRETARALQLARLEAELGALRRAIDERSHQERRRELVEERLRELLEGHPPSPDERRPRQP